MIHPKNQIQKERLLVSPLFLCMERAKYYTDVYKETEGEHPALRAAKALKRTLENMTIEIFPEELLVGNRASKHVAPPFACERGDFNFIFKYRLPDLKKFGYNISPEHEKILFKEILPYWHDRSVRHFKVEKFKKNDLESKLNFSLKEIRRKFKAFGAGNLIRMLGNEGKLGNGKKESLSKLRTIGKFFKLLFKLPKLLPAVKVGTADNVKGRGRCIDTQAHIVVGHKNVLKHGFKGIKEKAHEQLELTETSSERDFLRSIEIVCDAMKNFSLRYSALTQELAINEKDENRKNELLKLSKICENTPWNPPKTFHEAIQSMWFVQNVAIISYGAGSGITPGRVDQLLYPLYKKDIETGNITKELALRLVEEFIIKINNNVVVWPNIFGVTLNHLGSDIENITLGGVGRDGEDATNDLTYIFIEAIKNTKLATSSSFRYSKKSPPEYLRKIIELHKFTSGPAFYNDDIN
ncbi:MAG: pyruvate formate lyase family protein, partial [Candidatus Helarchaeota archaeon]